MPARTLIVFASSQGTAARAASDIQKALPGSALVRLGKDKIPPLKDYENIIIGGSIHAGSIQGSVKAFCAKNLKALLTHKIGLFLTCMSTGDTACQLTEKAFPPELITHAAKICYTGGAFIMEKMNFLEKFIISKVAGVTESVDKYDGQAVADFTREFL